MSGSQNPFANSTRRAGKAVEKSSFAHTCNLLSKFVKERGTLKDLHLAGMPGKSDSSAKVEEAKATTTLNLLSNIESSFQPSSQQGKSANPFSQSAPLTTASGNSSLMQPKRPSMTIFYAGKVLVFDDCSTEKVQEIMMLASGGASLNDHVHGSWNASNYDSMKPNPADAVVSCSKEQSIPVSAPLPVPVSVPVSVPAERESLKKPQAEGNTSDLPIARRSSLHRFLAKRKDRAGARAPYQLHNNNNNHNDRPESSSKNDQEQLELKL